MGWVNDKFEDRIAAESEVPGLWNRMRDSIGEAVVEFNAWTARTTDTLSLNDCMSKGKYCIRVQKAINNASIEIFLDEGSRSVHTSKTGRTPVTKICEYRITEDRKSAEFFVREPDGTARVITASEACRMAISEFIFSPFPEKFKKPLDQSSSAG